MADDAFDLVITRIERAASSVLRLTLVRPDGAALPAWTPGAHVAFHFAAGDVDFVRQYSLCGRTDDRQQWQVAVLLIPNGRGGSAHIHERFIEGHAVRVMAPRNNFPLVPAPRYLFIAGGIGITPMLPMISAASAAGADWKLVYCGRSAAAMAFIDDVCAFGRDRVILHESERLGRPDLAAIIAQSDPATEIYCCGPGSMLGAVEAACAALSRERLHMERFTPSEAPQLGDGVSFEVEFARSGIVATVPADRSILDVAEEAGIDIDSSCQEGVCRTCETRVLAGVPDHRDSVLSGKEREAGRTMLVCVSRACSARLVLDA